MSEDNEEIKKLERALKVSQMLVAAQEEQIHDQHLRLNAFKAAKLALSAQLEEATHTIKQSGDSLNYRQINLEKAYSDITWALAQTEEKIRAKKTAPKNVA